MPQLMAITELRELAKSTSALAELKLKIMRLKEALESLLSEFLLIFSRINYRKVMPVVGII